jgi:hypothetical protein
MAPVIESMKLQFRKDFGVAPFVSMDRAYFENPDMNMIADAKFAWDPLKNPDSEVGLSRYTMKGKTFCDAMVKWDSVGRDRPGQIAMDSDKVIKGPELLAKILKDTQDVDILLLATWNDLGEGTGLNRNYDYFYRGNWMYPDVFMGMLRRAQFPGN